MLLPAALDQIAADRRRETRTARRRERLRQQLRARLRIVA